MSLMSDSITTQIHFGNSVALQHLDLGFSDMSLPWRATIGDFGELESDPPFQDLTASFTKLQEWNNLEIHSPTRLQAVDMLRSFPKNDIGLWAEAAKATLTGKVYDVEGAARSLGSLPFDVDTMSPWTRLTSVQQMVSQVIRENIPGDFLEAGVWRGGTCIFVRALLNMFGAHDRTVWVVDSFRGLPPPSIEEDFDSSPNSPAYWSEDFLTELQVSRAEVESRFRDWGVAEGARFVEGFFNESIPRDVPSSTKLSILRADGDLYESTMDILFHSYHMLEMGGFFICDDCGEIDVARKAVMDFRRWHGITEPITNVDGATWYWRKRTNVEILMEYWTTLAEKRQNQEVAARLGFIQWAIDCFHGKGSKGRGLEVSDVMHNIELYWKFQELHPLIYAFLQKTAATMDHPDFRRSSGIKLLTKVGDLIWQAGPSHDLLLVGLALAKLLHDEGRTLEAFEISKQCCLSYGDLKALDLATVRSARARAFRELDVALSHGTSGFEELDTVFFGHGCFEELYAVEPPKVLQIRQFGMFPYSRDEIILGPASWKQKYRDACRQIGFYYALLEFSTIRYVEQLANHTPEHIFWQRILRILGEQVTSLEIGMCLPSACVVDAYGLQSVALKFILQSVMLRCQCTIEGLIYEVHRCPSTDIPAVPETLHKPRWRIDLNVTFDPGGMPDLVF